MTSSTEPRVYIHPFQPQSNLNPVYHEGKLNGGRGGFCRLISFYTFL